MVESNLWSTRLYAVSICATADNRSNGDETILEDSNEWIRLFLAVLKLFGEQDSFISFPMAEHTLALDFRFVLRFSN